MWKLAVSPYRWVGPSFIYYDGQIYVGGTHPGIFDRTPELWKADESQMLFGWFGQDEETGERIWTNYSAEIKGGNAALVNEADAIINTKAPVRYISEPFPKQFRAHKFAEVAAEYSDDDPLDVEGMMDLVNDLHSEWWTENPAQQRQAIANAFRAALTSPRQNLKWNSIVYQDLMHLPPEVDTPEEFEAVIRAKKEKWDRFGQQTIDMINENAQDEEFINYGPGMVEKYQPGIWKNIRNAAIVGPYIEDLRVAAIEDIKQGGDGRIFRRELMDLNIPGIGPKIAAFVWLLLAPKTSKLATIDVHMMRALGKDAESPKDLEQYLEFERELDAQREAAGYQDVPLGVYQWAVWDKTRTPGYHQDHTALRPLNPVDWRNVDWAPQERVRTKDNHIPPGQMSLDDPIAPVPAPPEQTQEFVTPPTAPTQTFSSWKLSPWSKTETIDSKQ